MLFRFSVVCCLLFLLWPVFDLAVERVVCCYNWEIERGSFTLFFFMLFFVVVCCLLFHLWPEFDLADERVVCCYNWEIERGSFTLFFFMLFFVVVCCLLFLLWPEFDLADGLHSAATFGIVPFSRGELVKTVLVSKVVGLASVPILPWERLVALFRVLQCGRVETRVIQ